jgi:hypothetical protein
MINCYICESFFPGCCNFELVTVFLLLCGQREAGSHYLTEKSVHVHLSNPGEQEILKMALAFLLRETFFLVLCCYNILKS